MRGKDLAKLLRAKQELLDEHTKPVGPGECVRTVCRRTVCHSQD